ncbi:putative transcriptional regulator, Crp/Fnr family protein [Planoprotostelium fungivorum]|uniref:Putative transcriptional regulator, Crp/Fnr family protein n=1 Tax=Planoprotostelium fungivorum TaxID=1890364 RepID=A0A2P6NPX0_9EUKA|nr:putative transcriptional regulator, Crp/Fnr family protein [Planoprotostelium fungivorum]
MTTIGDNQDRFCGGFSVKRKNWTFLAVLWLTEDPTSFATNDNDSRLRDTSRTSLSSDISMDSPTVQTDDCEAKLFQMPNGGTIVKTVLGRVQIGIPPETIKDSMKCGIDVPNYFVFGELLFDRKHGVNLAEAEFPAYWNFFIKKRVINFVCRRDQEIAIRKVFRETLLGPEKIDLSSEYPPHLADLMPDLHKEAQYLRTFDNIDELLHFHNFDRNGTVSLEGGRLKIHHDKSNHLFVFYEDDQETVSVSSYVSVPGRKYQGNSLKMSTKMFEPPVFGITILGNSSGFDPSHSTSGFILWIDRRGTMVDPPLNSKEILQKADAGTMQAILDETQITIMTTPTIMHSFLRKYSALTSLRESELQRLFTYKQPVTCGELMRINGADIRFHYSLHTIPCIGFEVFYGGKSIYFSGDTCNIPERIEEMHNQGRMSRGRYEYFTNFGWQHSLILHEAGIPPIHTPISILQDLPDDIKERLHLIHLCETSIPPESNLKIAKQGIDNTIALPVVPYIHSDAIQLLRVLEATDIFRNFTLVQAIEILSIAKMTKYRASEEIISEGSFGDGFYIVASGIGLVKISGRQKKHLIVGDFFGEMALIGEGKGQDGCIRTATVVAQTDMDVVSFDKTSFVSIIRGNHSLIDFMVKLAKARQDESWSIVDKNCILSNLTNAQKAHFQAVLYPVTCKKGDYLWRRGEKATHAYLVRTGSSAVYEEDALGIDFLHRSIDESNHRPTPLTPTTTRKGMSSGKTVESFKHGSVPNPNPIFIDGDGEHRKILHQNYFAHYPFGTGSFLAETDSLVSGTVKNHMTTALVLEDSTLYAIHQEDYAHFLERNPGVKLNLMGTIFSEAIQLSTPMRRGVSYDECEY